MTETPPQPLTHRRVLKIALPVVLSNVTVPILGAVDVGVVGQLGEAAPIGAVALGAVILSTAYWLFGFLRMGTVGLVGQAEGAGDPGEASAILSRALIIALSAGLLLIALQPLIVFAAFFWEPSSPEVETLARDYLGIRIWSAPCAIALFALTGWLVAQERTSSVFWMQLIINGLNIILNFWFVLGLDLGVSGVALATVIAEIAGASLGLWLCRSAFRGNAWRSVSRVFDRSRLILMARLNRDIFLRSLMLTAILTSFTFLGAGFGDETLAANQVLIQFLSISAFAMDGIAFAAESLVARAVGRRDPARIRRAVWLCSVWAAAICLILALGFALAGPWLIDLMAKDPNVQAASRSYLIWAIATPVLGCAPWILDGIFVGAARGRDMRNMMFVSFIAYCLAAASLMPAFANHGLWIALLISFAARGLSLGARFPALMRDTS